MILPSTRRSPPSQDMSDLGWISGNRHIKMMSKLCVIFARVFSKTFAAAGLHQGHSGLVALKSEEV